MLDKLLLLFHTVKYLKLKQIYYRIYYRFKKPQLSPLATQAQLAIASPFDWHGDCYTSRSIFSDGTAKFLNQTYDISLPSIWNDDSKAKLWLYNLHYLDDLNALDSEDRVQQQQAFVYRWIDENPPLKGTGWEPYTLSLRLVNLVKWCARHKVQDQKISHSLLQQADALSQLCEYHILANHLFANAKALVFIGAFLGDSLGKKYLELGLSILKPQMKEQFLADGAHFELSPMYHSVMLWDVLELIDLAFVSEHNALGSQLSQWKNIAAIGINWLNAMCHPDDDISFFNDAASGIAPKPKSIRAYAAKLGINSADLGDGPIVSMPVSGYTRVNLTSLGSVLLINHAEIQPDYQPGHAHADSLSFELSLLGHRVFVNTGTSQYGLGDERNRQRSTLAHNTLSINDQDSSEVWNGFRVARRAKIIEYSAETLEGKLVISTAHDGYRRLVSKAIHRRVFSAEANKLLVKDCLLVANQVNAKVRYHIHPEVKIVEFSDNSTSLELPNGKVVKVQVTGGIMSRYPYEYFPQFGLRVDSELIEVKMFESELDFILVWED